jgi:chaperone modulatory protein CbpM
MSPSDDEALQGILFDETAVLSIRELSRICAVDERHIVEFIDEGVLDAVVIESEWRLSGSALRRTRLALRLERDLELNLPGVALALNLMEEIERLRRELGARR